MARTKEFDCDKALDEAMAVFWKKGYQSTSIQDLVDATGVNRASLYETFGGKHRIFEKALERFRQADNKNFSVLAADKPAGLKRIEALFRLIADDVLADPRGCPIVNCVAESASSDPWIAGIGKLSREEIERVFETQVKQAINSGELPKGRRPKALARYLTNSVLGLRVMARMLPEKQLIHDIVATTLASLR
jgi:TetR/AcrR family transcriptional repressor of nem operon